MADADTTSAVLQSAGFEDVTFTRVDLDIKIGGDLDAAVELVTGLGPAGELIRLAEEEGDRRRPEIEAALRDSLAEYARDDGVHAPASTWVIGARAPGA